MCKQLNGPVLKSLKTKRSGPKWEKQIVGSGQNFLLCFGLGRAQVEFFSFLLAAPGPRNPARAEVQRDPSGEKSPDTVKSFDTIINLINFIVIKHRSIYIIFDNIYNFCSFL